MLVRVQFLLAETAFMKFVTQLIVKFRFLPTLLRPPAVRGILSKCSVGIFCMRACHVSPSSWCQLVPVGASCCVFDRSCTCVRAHAQSIHVPYTVHVFHPKHAGRSTQTATSTPCTPHTVHTPVTPPFFQRSVWSFFGEADMRLATLCGRLLSTVCVSISFLPPSLSALNLCCSCQLCALFFRGGSDVVCPLRCSIRGTEDRDLCKGRSCSPCCLAQENTQSCSSNAALESLCSSRAYCDFVLPVRCSFDSLK